MVSLAGLAVTRLPATVARFRNWGEPISQQGGADVGGSDDVVVGDESPEAQLPFGCLDAVELRNPGEIDEGADIGADAAVQLEEQVGPAGDDPCGVANTMQDRKRILEGGGSLDAFEIDCVALHQVHHALRPL